jgi:CHASE3 domain sensor protein
MSYNLYQQANDITKLVYNLDNSHKLNAKILFETLEFRRIEYRCYLGKENPEFLKSMNNTLKNYVEYVSNDTKLTAEQKKILMSEVTQIEQAVEARIELTDKLVEYDKSRRNYLDSLGPIVTEKTTKYSQILNK